MFNLFIGKGHVRNHEVKKVEEVSLERKKETEKEFANSIEVAKNSGVSDENILKNIDEIDNYFMD